MNDKKEFIKFLLEADVLRFGDFTGKSGRKMPYFINAGNLRTGVHMAKLGQFYAKIYREKFDGTPALFGPAYKGIPIAVSTAVALAADGIDAPCFFNRKEEKDHGEGGVFVGSVPARGQSVVIVEDVITAGTAVRESMRLLSSLDGVNVVGLIIMVDRKERGQTELSAVAEVTREFGFPVYPFVTVDDIVGYLKETGADADLLARVDAYRAEYGAK